MIDLQCFIYYVSLYDVDLISLICIMIYDVDVHFRVRDWSILNLPPEPRILDEDYNLVIAPIMQRRGQKLVEVKHGDLAPGKAHGKGGKGGKGNGERGWQILCTVQQFNMVAAWTCWNISIHHDSSHLLTNSLSVFVLKPFLETRNW